MIDLAQETARQNQSFARTIGRLTTSSGVGFEKINSQLREQIPELVANCQSGLDENLPKLMKSTNAATLAARLAECSDHDMKVLEETARVREIDKERKAELEKRLAEQAAATEERMAAELQEAATTGRAPI